MNTKFPAAALRRIKRAVSPRRGVITLRKDKFLAYTTRRTEMDRYSNALTRVSTVEDDNQLKQLRFMSLQRLVANVLRKELEGDFAECGCWKGHSTSIVATMLRESGMQKGFHVFDSFEGGLSEFCDKDRSPDAETCEPSVRDEAECQERATFFSSYDTVKKNLSDFEFVDLYPGWIPTRFQEVEGRQFCFVHIDVDLYEPTLQSLEFFYSRLVKGGVIVVDDYGYSHFSGASVAVDEFLTRMDPELFYETPVGTCFIVK